MDSPQRISIKEPQVILSPCTSRRRRTSNDSNSPEFEFWMVRNPSFPQPNLVSADELFVGGVLLPLHLLHHQNNDSPDSPEPEPPNASHPQPDPDEPGPKIPPASITLEPTSSSKRWKDMIFKKGDKKTSTTAKKKEEKEKEREKKREKKSKSGASSAELNINIWPFSRSRSAGNSGSRPKLFTGAPAARKVSSAPCSRSNSAGESKSRKSWPSSPGRPGVHLGRSSPVWQIRRGGGGSSVRNSFSEPVVRSSEKMNRKKEVTEPPRPSKTRTNGNGSSDGGGGGAKVLNINVPMCMGYRNHLGCRSDANSAISSSSSGGGGTARNGGGGTGGNSSSSNGSINAGNGSNLFNLRSLFTKKVY